MGQSGYLIVEKERIRLELSDIREDGDTSIISDEKLFSFLNYCKDNNYSIKYVSDSYFERERDKVKTVKEFLAINWTDYKHKHNEARNKINYFIELTNTIPHQYKQEYREMVELYQSTYDRPLSVEYIGIDDDFYIFLVHTNYLHNKNPDYANKIKMNSKVITIDVIVDKFREILPFYTGFDDFEITNISNYEQLLKDSNNDNKITQKR